MTDRVLVWDRFVRLFHWSLLTLIAGCWATSDSGKTLHEAMGYAIGALIAMRLVWGFIGPRHARFADFVRGPRAVLGYLRDLLAGHEPPAVPAPDAVTARCGQGRFTVLARPVVLHVRAGIGPGAVEQA